MNNGLMNIKRTVNLAVGPKGRLQPSTTKPQNIEDVKRRREEESVAATLTKTLEVKDARIENLKKLDQSERDLNSEPGAVAVNRAWLRKGSYGDQVDFQRSEFLTFDVENGQAIRYDSATEISGDIQESYGSPKIRIEAEESMRYTPQTDDTFQYSRKSLGDAHEALPTEYSETVKRTSADRFEVSIESKGSDTALVKGLLL